MTRFNALFHWAVPPGREIEAGREVGRHYIMTHAYWREGGPEFHNVNVMGVAHGMEKPALLAHKAAIDAHLSECGMPVSYTNVFWGGRSEIKPSEIAPAAYREWCRSVGQERGEMDAGKRTSDLIMPSVYIKTYGCQMNERDSEAVAAQLVAKGYTLAPSEAGGGCDSAEHLQRARHGGAKGHRQNANHRGGGAAATAPMSCWVSWVAWRKAGDGN